MLMLMTSATMRLAQHEGFAGKNAWEEALVDSIASQYKDYLEEVRPFFRVVEALGKDVFLPANKKFFAFITKFLKDNKSGYLVGDSLTWVDLLVAESATFTDKFPTLYDGFSEVKAHAEKIRSIPELKKWIETRPASDY
ncbi:glutathione S-transferase protein [Ostertagia ostertagi]